jgi:transcription-repair coupling factor (superfamily II helicase)
VKPLLNLIATDPDFKKLTGRFLQGEPDLLTGVSASQKSLVVAALTQVFSGQLLVICHSDSQAERMATDLETLTGKETPVYFPHNELLPHEEAFEPEVTAARVAALGRILRDEAQLVVTSWAALQRRLIAPEQFQGFLIELEVGREYSLEQLTNQLVGMGYERVEQVQALGQFNQHGDILDLFPLDADDPFRLEFFGDEIDTIRRFRVEDQLSVARVQQMTVLPAREGLWTFEAFQRALPIMEADLQEQADRLEDLGRVKEAASLQGRFREALERLGQGHQLPGSDQFLPWIAPRLVSLLDYLPQARIILDEPVRGLENYRGLAEETAAILAGFLEKGVVLPREAELFLATEELERAIWGRRPWSCALLTKTPREHGAAETLTLPFRTPPAFHSKVDHLAQEIARWQKRQMVLIMAVAAKERAVRLREVLREQGIASHLVSAGAELRLEPGTLQIVIADLEAGLEWIPGRILLLTEAEIYGRQRQRARLRFKQEGARISAFTDLKPGDYVVHINHGIGRFVGLETLEIAGSHRDYLRIEYAGTDRLFVPTDQLGLIQRYIGGADAPPKLNKLGGADWQKLKGRVKESLRDMAEALLELYAQREAILGHAFTPDTVWQHEMEEGFYYEETPDQFRAIQEIKADMEKPKPMDRLLCGDVGYGKTEVAMRAAFKSIMDGKQVGVLVPTTILTQQHFLTFRERFAGYPIVVKVLSRFQSPREQEVVVSGLLKGEVDLVIGTHRLLSGDIYFKNLGLLVIDEEQRFGVAHKEKIKQLRQNVDVLTLTATPIPRTLHMALAGIRDMSVIETPPQGRFPIRTHVMEFNEEVIREAIQRELDRKGQAYFVYNRVATIERMASYLQNLLPQARIAVAHGQMDEDQLEQVMLAFNDGEADILVCSTIIETGLDIPNVNTLVVYDADRFGLAQLYQLRGRVGRSTRIAHAYFCYRREKMLSENAEKRLAAIREFTELGSGFKIAMRDLEIRGAGNLLGPEQHGQIAAIGFELYCRLLEETIRERKGESAPELPEPIVELLADAYLPGDFISDNRQKVELYKQVAEAASVEAVNAVYDAILDRFGNPPPPVENLLNLAKLKALAREIGLASLMKEKNEFVGKLHIGLNVNHEAVLAVLAKYRQHFRYQAGRPVVLHWKLGLPEPEFIRMVVDSLEMMRKR